MRDTNVVVVGLLLVASSLSSACVAVRVCNPPGAADPDPDLPTCACRDDAAACEDSGVSRDGGPDTGAPADAGPCGVCDPGTPVCVGTQCEECTAVADALCVDATPVCDPGSNTCVGCVVDGDCTQLDAPQCGTEQECGACSGNEACVGRTGTLACDAVSGACVECTATNTAACGGNPCRPDGTCSAYGTNRQLCQACDTDANCAGTGNYCVPMNFGATPRGGYCLQAVPGCARPYSVATGVRETLGGVEGMSFCGINETLTTCEAVRALIDDVECPGGTDGMCPEGGLCRTVGVLTNRCTYRCGGASECISPPTAGNTCGSTDAMDFCGGMD